jgi:sporulation protein YlmC with PRC-barrel domain
MRMTGKIKDIPMDTKVRCTDGKCGKSTYVIVNPVEKAITHFVVKYKKLPENRDRLVPVAKIADISEGLISLSCSRAELAKMQPFTTTRYVKTEAPLYIETVVGEDPYGYFAEPVVALDTDVASVPEVHIPAHELAIYRGMDVSTGEGKVGAVDEMVVDPDSGNITHLLMRKGHLWGKKDVAIPVTAIDVVDKDRVFLNIDKEAIGALPAVPVKRR